MFPCHARLTRCFPWFLSSLPVPRRAHDQENKPPVGLNQAAEVLPCGNCWQFDLIEVGRAGTLFDSLNLRGDRSSLPERIFQLFF